LSALEQAIVDLVRAAVRAELEERRAAAEPDLERLPDVARRFSVSVSWLEARVKAGELALHGRGHMRRCAPAEVRALLHRRNTASPPDPASRAEKILRSLPGGKAR
jgi:hypothetical protein